MAVRRVEDTPTSHYAILGISRYASAEDIKRAYRDKAKEAHPDAGGSAEAMARVNNAYQTLSDPLKRRDYDAVQSRPAEQPTYRATTATRSYEASPTARPRPRQSPDPGGASDHHEHLRRRWARGSAAEIARTSFLAVVGLTILTLYFAPRFAEPPAFYLLFMIILVPTFLMLFGALAFIDPSLRLAIFDISPRYRIYPTRRQWRVAGRILAIAVVMSMVWAWMMVSISTPKEAQSANSVFYGEVISWLV